jgi:type VI secretion system protein ImpH
MFSSRWRQNTSVIERLLAKPHEYGFFQTVRLLERALLVNYSARELQARVQTVGGFAPPNTEILQFRTKSSLSFPESDIVSIEGDLSDPSVRFCKVQTNFLSIAGSSGVLPYHYTEFILQRLKAKDTSLAQFLDLFNHRLISLFFQADAKYKFALEPERKQLKNQRSALPTTPNQLILGMIGMGTRGLSTRLQFNDETLLFYSGLLSHKVRSAQGLKQMLADYFQLPVKIQEFVGQWQALLPDFCTRLASRAEPLGQNARLGQSAMLGARGWIAQGKIRIVLGPLTKAQFYQFAPGTKALAAMNDMVRFYMGLEHDYEFVIEVNRADLPNKIQLSNAASPILGWNTWLSSSQKPSAGNSSKTFKITVSAK